MVHEKLVSYISEGELSGCAIRIYSVRACKDDELVNEYQSNIDVEQYSNESQPIKILPVEVDKVTLVPLFQAFSVKDTKRAFHRVLKDKCDRRKDVAIEWEDFYDEPKVNSLQSPPWVWCHLTVLGVENSGLVLEYGNGIKHFLKHVETFGVGNDWETVEDRRANVSKVNLHKHVFVVTICLRVKCVLFS